MIARRLHHLAHPRRIANIARIDPQTGGTGLGCLDGAAIMEMDIGNNRNRTLRTNSFQRRGAVFIRQDTRTISAPAAAAALICAKVLSISLVSCWSWFAPKLAHRRQPELIRPSPDDSDGARLFDKPYKRLTLLHSK